ncbi:LOW QUALITY PROTEIN: tripartite motif-containing protein 66 [Brienomyrus brachyistius]|uniref:LOW QUALITY PROTEIN: tripartite motif-containing protein 66 n=1 Tax=Brienomyrus brachyistius TaxID=42636 RepID=UPI0020B2F095|nr:LOW QUALITY PROTEIN: tripartite motif-containing protein 66 [Brienomyrus brachyistius]
MDKRCTDCREPRAAQSLCTLCNKRLCYQCTSMHQDHTLAIPSASPGPPLLPEAGRRHAYMGPSCWSSSSLHCHYHRQEPLDLFCETCDLLSCSSCHLFTHKDHRLIHVGKALQEQHWLFENLMAQVEDKRLVVGDVAKQIEARLHSIKNMQRKAENQIKMAKMIMMNELTKRANLLIEQLEKISSEVRQNLETQLQGVIELCAQLGQAQNFISWATLHNRRNPLLFSKELITYQMQCLLVSQLYSDLAPPVKIKFNWDASFWTRQISTLGQVTTEGGSGPHCEGGGCPSVLKPQPIPCTTAPLSLCRSSLEQGYGFRPQLCCAHCATPPKSDRPHPDLLIGHTRVPALGQGSLCHPLSSYPEKSLQRAQPVQPKSVMKSVTRVEDKRPEQNLHGPKCIRAAQSLPSLHQGAQLVGHLDPHNGLVPVAHPQPLPAQHFGQALLPTTDTYYLGFSHSLPRQPAPAQSSLPITLQYSSEPNRSAQLSPGPERQQGRPAAIWSKPEPAPKQIGLAADWSGSLPERQVTLTCAEQSSGDTGEQQVVGHCSRKEDGTQQLPVAAGLNPTDMVNHHNQAASTQGTADPANAATPPTTACAGTNQDVQGKHATAQLQQRKEQAVSPGPGTSPERQGRRQPAETEQRRLDSGDQRKSTPPRMLEPDHDLPRASLQGARPGSRRAPEEWAAPLSSPLGGDSAGSTLSLATVSKERGQAPRQGDRSSPHVQSPMSNAAVSLSRSNSASLLCVTPVTACKTEPDICPYEEIISGGKDSSSTSRKELPRMGQGVIKIPGSSRVPVVRLERLKIRVKPGFLSKPPVDGEIGPGADSALKREGATTEDPQQRLSTKEQAAALCWSPLNSETFEQISADIQPSFSPDADVQSSVRPRSEEPLSELAPSTRAEPELDPGPPAELDQRSESEPSSESSPRSESEPRSESDLPSESEPDLDLELDVESEADSESEQQPESDPGLESDSPLESDSDLESEQQPESDISAESEPEFESQLESEQDSNSDADQIPEIIAESDPDPGGLCVHGASPHKMAEAVPLESDHHEEAVAMENEDFCAVCLNGGDLLCCDRCPKVFHLSCHIPPLLSFPTGDWVCTLCRDIQEPEMEYDCENMRHAAQNAGKATLYGLSPYDQRKCEKLTMSIACNILSAPFHEPVSPLARHYYQIIRKPMDLSVIRNKLNKRNPLHYYTPEEFVTDVFLMFRNCAKFNYPDSEVAQAGRNLEAFFSAKLQDVFPDRVFPVLDDDSDSEDYDEAYRAGVAGFLWPEKKEQSHRKRKRRHSAHWRRQHL